MSFQIKSAFKLMALCITFLSLNGCFVEPQNNELSAYAGSDIKVTRNTSVNLIGEVDSSDDTTILQYQWRILSKPTNSNVRLINNQRLNAEFIAYSSGQYELQLLVNNGQYMTTDEVIIQVENRAPVVNAGVDQIINRNQKIHLDASESYDLDGDDLKYTWTVISQPAESNLTFLREQQSVEVSPLASGEYIFSLEVFDGEASQTERVKVIVTNQPPIARSGNDFTMSKNQSITLDAGLSNDPDGDELSYSWDILESPAGSYAALSTHQSDKPVFHAQKAGLYRLRLTVSDGLAESSDELVIEMVNTAPVSNAGDDQQVGKAEQVNLIGSNSSDSNDDGLTYSWSIKQKPDSSHIVLNDASTSHANFKTDGAGDYTFILTVSDGDKTDTDEITVTAINLAPTVFSGHTNHCRRSSICSIYGGNRATDADGDELTFLWSIKSRPIGSKAVLTQTTTESTEITTEWPGNYTLLLKVSDGELEGSNEIDVEIVNAAPAAVVSAITETETGNVVELDGSSSWDLDGNDITYNWQLVGKPSGSSAFINNAEKPISNIIFDVQGEYTVALTVGDGLLDSNPKKVKIIASKKISNYVNDLSEGGLNNFIINLHGVSSNVVNDGRLLIQSGLNEGDSAYAALNLTKILSGYYAKPARNFGRLIMSFDVEITKSSTCSECGESMVVSLGNQPDPVNDNYMGYFLKSNSEDLLEFSVNAKSNSPVGYLDQNVGLNYFGIPSTPSVGKFKIIYDSVIDNWKLFFEANTSNNAADISTLLGSFTNETLMNYELPYLVFGSKNGGTAAFDNLTIDVISLGESSNAHPIADAGANQYVKSNAFVELNGENSTDPDGDLISFQWSIVSKPEDSMTFLSDVYTSSPTFTVDKDGEYIVKLVVSDGVVDSSESLVYVAVGEYSDIYENSFDSNLLGAISITNNGASIKVENEALIIRPQGSTGFASLNLSKVLKSYRSQLSENTGKLVISYTIENKDAEICGACNNGFMVALSSTSSSYNIYSSGYAWHGGSYVGDRMQFSSGGPGHNVLYETVNGLSSTPYIGAFKWVYDPKINQWDLYFEQSTEGVIDASEITTKVASFINKIFVNTELPYLLFSSRIGDSAKFDNIKVELKYEI